VLSKFYVQGMRIINQRRK